jgi:hypothetical protein
MSIKSAMHTRAKRAKIAENKVVLCSISDQLVALSHQMVGNGNIIGHDLLNMGVRLKQAGVGGGAEVGLHVDAPGGQVQALSARARQSPSTSLMILLPP